MSHPSPSLTGERPGAFRCARAPKSQSYRAMHGEPQLDPRSEQTRRKHHPHCPPSHLNHAGRGRTFKSFPPAARAETWVLLTNMTVGSWARTMQLTLMEPFLCFGFFSTFIMPRDRHSHRDSKNTETWRGEATCPGHLRGNRWTQLGNQPFGFPKLDLWVDSQLLCWLQAGPQAPLASQILL